MTNPRFRGGYPLVRRVAKTDPEGAWSLMRAIATVAPIHANDNEPAATYAGSDDYEPRGPAAAVRATERTHKITPTVNQILADALRPRVVSERRKDTGTRPGLVRVIVRKHAGMHDVQQIGPDAYRLADMVFLLSGDAKRAPAGGLMVSYGSTKRGKPLEPRVDTREERGGKTASRSEAAVRSYLAVRATPEHTTRLMSPPAIPAMLDPTDRAAEARRLLRSLGVDGSVSLVDACAAAGLLPRTALPARVAWKADFIGGVKAPKETAKSPAPDLWATNPADDVRELSPHVQVILEEIAARGSLKSLGIRLGYSRHYADRAGKDALHLAVEAVRHIFTAPKRLAANDNVPFRAALAGKS